MQIIFGIILIFYSIYIPVYVFIFDSEESAVKSVNLADSMYIHSLTTYDRSEDEDRKRDAIDALVDKYEDRTGIDLSDSIYDLLDDSGKVKNIEVVEGRRMNNMSYYSINYEYNGSINKINFIVQSPSFWEFSGAKAILEDNPQAILNRLERILR